MLAQIEELQLEDFDEATTLIDRCMRPDADLSMALDFPLLIGRNAKSRRLIVRQEDRIVSHVAGRLAVVQLPHGQLIQCLNLGAVCTDRQAHGHGFARQLIDEQLRLAMSEGVELAMLWSEIDGFYEKHGFEKAGCESRFAVSRQDLVRISPIEWRWMSGSDIPELLKLRMADPCPVSRPNAEAQVLFNLPRSKTLVALDRQRVIAYLTFGKGLDFEGAVCEWGGDMANVVRLLPSLFEAEGLESVLMIGPGWHDVYVETFTRLGCPGEFDALGMFRVLNSQSLATALASNPGTTGSAEGLNLSLSQLIGCGNPMPTRPLLPFYVWGLDSM